MKPQQVTTQLVQLKRIHRRNWIFEICFGWIVVNSATFVSIYYRRRGRVVRAWDTLTVFEATVCGRSWIRSPTGAIYIVGWVFHPTRWLARFSLIWKCLSFQILNLFRTLSSWGSDKYRSSAPLLYEVANHVKQQLPFRHYSGHY